MFTQTKITIEALGELSATIDRIVDKIDALRSENKQLKDENAKLKEELNQLKKSKSKLDSSWNHEFEHSDDWRKVYEMGQL